MEKKTIFVLFGATGDLTKRKLVPAFYNLFKKGQVTKEFEVLGIGRKTKTDEEFKEDVRSHLVEFGKVGEVEEKFVDRVIYSKVEFDGAEDYDYLRARIDELSDGFETQIVFYLALPQKVFFPVIDNLRRVGLNEDNHTKKKIVFEKPFGSDLASARELNDKIMSAFKEEQVYRIDHYLGKDAVQNLLVLRFANYFLEPLWNYKFIDNVQITAFESLGVEKRGRYYESSGALRDMIQNHLFKMVSLIAMEPPVKLDADFIRDEKMKVFSSIKNLYGNWQENVVFGQYKEGEIEGKKVVGYRQEEGVSEESKTETYVAMKLEVDNWRWTGVPFYLRTGKRMKKKGTTVVIEFKKIPSILYNHQSDLETNKLIIEVQPNEGIDMQFNIKSPSNGNGFTIDPIQAKFNHDEYFKSNAPEGYEVLLNEIMKGDHTLFSRWDGVQESWKIVDNLVDCRDNCPMIHFYESGGRGPDAAERLLEKDGRKWHNF